MNILHINQSDIVGGAGISGYRLHQGLLARSVNSRMLVGTAQSNDPHVEQLKRVPGFRMPLNILSRSIGLNYFFLPFGFGVPSYPAYKNADIVNLHNLHTGYFNYLAIRRIALHRPVVYTLHDMWSFTGHCAFSYDCERWKSGCGKCPYPDNYPKIFFDNTRLEWNIKKRLYRSYAIDFVVPSKWMLDLVNKSLLREHSIHYIPHGIDKNTFQSFDKNQCRNMLNLPRDRYVILFAAHKITDPRKGNSVLREIIKRVPDDLRKKILLVAFGHEQRQFPDIGAELIQLGYIANDRLKSIVYSAADVFIHMSLAESFGLVLQESLACGTPMIAFNSGGVSEIIVNNETGFLIDLGNIVQFSLKLTELLGNEDVRKQMGRKCAELAAKKHDISLQIDRYMELYERVLVNWKARHTRKLER